MSSITSGGPVATGSGGEIGYQRIDSLDFIRGFAILGILIMNVYSMALPPIAYSAPQWRYDGTVVDTAIYVFQSIFVESRFMSIFALLFGVGIALQMDRMAARGVEMKSRRRRLRRRMAWLLVFGLIHGFLLWSGDILTLYALSGFIVMRVTHWRPRRLVTVGVVLIAVAQAALVMAFLGSYFAGENIMEVPPLPFGPAEVAAARETWTTVPARIVRNAVEFGEFLVVFPVMMVWHAVGVMMIGIALYRRGFFTDPRGWRWGVPSLAVGTAVGAGVLWARYAVGIDTSAGQSLLGVMMIAGLLCAIGYISLLVPVAGRTGAVAQALRNAGKTAFTLYLGQTVVTLLIFVVILRPWWGTWDRATLLGYVAVLSVIQLVYANWQQTRFGRGPLERLWRWLAAGRERRGA